jgi:hypothetical protein
MFHKLRASLLFMVLDVLDLIVRLLHASTRGVLRVTGYCLEQVKYDVERM